MKYTVSALVIIVLLFILKVSGVFPTKDDAADLIIPGTHLFFEVENQTIQIKDVYARNESGGLTPVQIPVSFGYYNWGKSGGYLICVEGSQVRSGAFDSGIAEVKLNHAIPAKTYDIWYRITSGGNEFAEDSKWYGWIEWSGGKTEKKDLGPFLRENERRNFKGWVKVAERVKLPDLKAEELMCFGEDADNTNRHVYAIWDAICLSDNPNFVPPEQVPVGGWEGKTELLPSEKISLDQKKVITLGGGAGPTPDYVMLKVRAMEKILPVDGIVMSLRAKDAQGSYPVCENIFTPDKIHWEEVEGWVKDLKNTAFTTFKDNFIDMNVVPGAPEGMDWFDDEIWNTIIDKWKLLVTVAKEGDLKGIFIDTEQYSDVGYGVPFMYSKQLHSSQKSFEEYREQVRKRGQQLMEAIQEIYPDITIILTYSTSLLALPKMPDPDLSKASYGLLPAFVDGLLEGGPKATFVDGWEGAYLYTQYQQFVDAYVFIKEQGANLSEIPEIYKERMKVGFGIWVEKFKREDLKYALHYALRVSDGYVWFYMSGVKAWQPTPQIEAACRDISWALKESRKDIPLQRK